MEAGKLRDRIKILAQTKAKTQSGQEVETWAVFAQVWADVQQIGGREQLRAGRELAPSEYSIRIRYRDGITASMRIELKSGKRLSIDVPQSDRHKGWITLTATEVS